MFTKYRGAATIKMKKYDKKKIIHYQNTSALSSKTSWQLIGKCCGIYLRLPGSGISHYSHIFIRARSCSLVWRIFGRVPSGVSKYIAHKVQCLVYHKYYYSKPLHRHKRPPPTHSQSECQSRSPWAVYWNKRVCNKQPELTNKALLHCPDVLKLCLN